MLVGGERTRVGLKQTYLAPQSRHHEISSSIAILYQPLKTSMLAGAMTFHGSGGVVCVRVQ